MDSQHASEKKYPFVVPEHYFEQFTDQIMQRIGRKEKTLLQRCRSYMKWAAVLVVGATGIWMTIAVSMSHDINREKHSKQLLKQEADETIFDTQFNPTCDEIIEYLVSEVDDCEMLLADNN